ncbi:putative oligomerization/nucleic acid binding protein [Mucilaginibacter yixingensis]|uniref:Putative oligomerization/nucleic acid binding protein n=1 Tax=Mucilaginibacter yixingensis TaxID=1295612 RepID=A0A2T5J5Q5_9SPHI|nr:SHOCT domain-containing protein [Mucilaginibacter yixingensis]PTQ93596.1 putative oligomerization/nucleic acid binding protein [Mucilaginibacter yixingensis]
MALGTTEIIFLLSSFLITVVIPSIWGYKVGAQRSIGAIVGLLLGFFLSYIGIIIVYLMPSKLNSAADELQKYKQLLDSGAITEQEYQDQKTRILG